MNLANLLLSALWQIGKVAFALGVLALISWPLLKKWIEDRLSSGFARRLETHKHELQLLTESQKHQLQLLTEQARFEYSRKLTDLNLYAARRDAAAAHLYATLIDLHESISELGTPPFEPPMDDFAKLENLSNYLDVIAAPAETRAEVLAHWQHDKEEALMILRLDLRTNATEQAVKKLDEAKTIAYSNNLYFSDESITTINAFLQHCDLWLVAVMQAGFLGERSGKMPPMPDIAGALYSVRKALRGELAPATVLSLHP